MKKTKQITFSLIYLLFLSIFISCRGQESDGFVEALPPIDPPVITPISEDKCDNNIQYAGIKDVSDITDNSAKISWHVDANTIGYTLFRVTPDKFEVVANLKADQNEFQIKNLSEETDYEFIIRTTNVLGAYDCNENSFLFRTTDKQTFTSCQEIHLYYQGAKPSSIYEIDSDSAGPNEPFTVYCDMDNNAGGWTRVFTHNTSAGFFKDDAEATEHNLVDPMNEKYSILSRLEHFKKEGKFEFWIYYPEHDGVDGGNIWTQTSNPVSDPIADYVATKIDYTGMYWGGLEKSSSSSTLIDGSVGSSWWFYAIGANKKWPTNGTFPGPLRNTGVTEAQLFIR